MSVCSKLFERHVSAVILQHLSSVCHYRIISGTFVWVIHCFCFISCTHKWYQSLESGAEIAYIAKAFDSVPHFCLIQHLVSIGLSPLYLQVDSSGEIVNLEKFCPWKEHLHHLVDLQLFTSRAQGVVVGGEKSSVLSVFSGVLQGSVLGPFCLLTVFINSPSPLTVFLIAMLMICYCIRLFHLLLTWMCLCEIML